VTEKSKKEACAPKLLLEEMRKQNPYLKMMNANAWSFKLYTDGSWEVRPLSWSEIKRRTGLRDRVVTEYLDMMLWYGVLETVEKKGRNLYRPSRAYVSELVREREAEKLSLYEIAEIAPSFVATFYGLEVGSLTEEEKKELREIDEGLSKLTEKLLRLNMKLRERMLGEEIDALMKKPVHSDLAVDWLLKTLNLWIGLFGYFTSIKGVGSPEESRPKSIMPSDTLLQQSREFVDLIEKELDREFKEGERPDCANSESPAGIICSSLLGLERKERMRVLRETRRALEEREDAPIARFSSHLKDLLLKAQKEVMVVLDGSFPGILSEIEYRLVKCRQSDLYDVRDLEKRYWSQVKGEKDRLEDPDLDRIFNDILESLGSEIFSFLRKPPYDLNLGRQERKT